MVHIIENNITLDVFLGLGLHIYIAYSYLINWSIHRGSLTTSYIHLQAPDYICKTTQPDTLKLRHGKVVQLEKKSFQTKSIFVVSSFHAISLISA